MVTLKAVKIKSGAAKGYWSCGENSQIIRDKIQIFSKGAANIPFQTELDALRYMHMRLGNGKLNEKDLTYVVEA